MMNQNGPHHTQYRNNSSGGFTPRHNKPPAQNFRPNYSNNNRGPPKPGGNHNHHSNNNQQQQHNNHPNGNNNNPNNAPKTGSNTVPINPKDKSTINCYECGVVGHYSNECPKKLARIAANTAAPAQQQRRFAGRKNQNNNNGRLYHMNAAEAQEAPQAMPTPGRRHDATPREDADVGIDVARPAPDANSLATPRASSPTPYLPPDAAAVPETPVPAVHRDVATMPVPSRPAPPAAIKTPPRLWTSHTTQQLTSHSPSTSLSPSLQLTGARSSPAASLKAAPFLATIATEPYTILKPLQSPVQRTQRRRDPCPEVSASAAASRRCREKHDGPAPSDLDPTRLAPRTLAACMRHAARTRPHAGPAHFVSRRV
ncbi:hypothetical protein QYE76_013017 [Lolium multiflorum]|uniref:CCHC-type domain-containing protein n=1 Tax=Lolium multiflorum TaxID=4521 RepID=A0AAD8X5H9_LOLMU|nr:hypothetical protein QYE76_013017 [Lolium multiflorum]